MEEVLSEKLAPGALPGQGFIPLCIPQVEGNEWTYVKECLDTGWVSSVGSYVDRFEQLIAAFVGSRFAIATVNGTAAIHIALIVSGVEADDEVLVSNVTFAAPVNAIRYLGAWPVLVDAEPRYWQMDVEKVAEFLRTRCVRENGELRNRATGRRVRAILPVHILGHPCDLDPLMALASEFGLQVVEDATESLGARYKGRRVGTFGSTGCFSFNGNKIITTGGGGMVVTDDEAIAKKVRYLTTQAKDDPVEYFHREVGYNYRMTNVLAAIGCAQMEQLERYIEKKRSIARRYDEAFQDVPGITTHVAASWAESIHWLYTILIDRDSFGAGSRDVLAEMEKEKIQTRPLWTPMNQLPPFAACETVSIVESPRLHRDALSLPSSVGLTDGEATRVIESLKAVRGPVTSAVR